MRAEATRSIVGFHSSQAPCQGARGSAQSGNRVNPMGAGRLGDDASTDLTNDRREGNSARLPKGPDGSVGGKRRLGRTCDQLSPAVPAGLHARTWYPAARALPGRPRLASCAPRRHDALFCLVAIEEPGLGPKIGRRRWAHAVLPSFLRAPDWSGCTHSSERLIASCAQMPAG